ncbi:fam-a protein [Plasmodium vinckei brucechwatti]|uniref:Fam-a protein n=1 Tax=Plasmodium vinckei brucechwatti TaxID=119398 RepID=A0A6V7SB94_PLAVN|nr:fam-a protein [Plasmodium vinckei brucechwatti]
MNMFYIQIALFLLSIFIYVNNKSLATELGPKKAPPKVSQKVPNKATNKSTTFKQTDHCITDNPEEIFEKNNKLLCTDPKETKEAEELMNEAVKQLEIHATDMRNYKLCVVGKGSDPTLYKKKLENNTDVEKFEYEVYGFNRYDEIINEIWDPDHANPFNSGSVKIARVYNPNLVIIQKRYKKKIGSRQKYFYALATKAQISEDTTIIVYVSTNINDRNPSKKQYENKIIKKANSFKTDIDSEEDIRKGKLKKTFVNLAGFLIEKKDEFVYITYILSINGHASIKHLSLCGIRFSGYCLNE